MSLGVEAYEKLYGKSPKKRIVVSYHGRFSEYNANVRMTAYEISFHLSRKFENCEPEIQIGVIQHLLNKLNKTKIDTDEQEYYHSFLKKMSDYAPVTESDDVLSESFDRVNEEYFHGMMSKPNLVWGNRTKSLLGTYTYGSDTITISKVLEDAPKELLDFVMFHEMLHKKHKFSCKSGRTHSHTPAFKKEEKSFKLHNPDKQLTKWLRSGIKPKEDSSFLKRVMGWK